MAKHVRAVYYNPARNVYDTLRAVRNLVGAGKAILGSGQEGEYPILFVNGSGEIDELIEGQYLMVDEAGPSSWNEGMVTDFWELVSHEDDFVSIWTPKMSDKDKLQELIEDVDHGNSWYAIEDEQAEEIADAILAAGFKRG